MVDFFNTFWDVLVHWATTGRPLTKIRSVLGMLFLILLSYQYYKTRFQRKRMSREAEKTSIEKNYEKNVDGLYPWEADTDDSPKRIEKNARPISTQWGPQRGRWS